MKETGTIPFDVPGVELGLGPDGRCLLESIIVKVDLKEPGLLRLARIVRCADAADDLDQDPVASGLEATAAGYSLRFFEDEENVLRQLQVYDARYASCRLPGAKAG